VQQAMNEINTQKRLRVAAVDRGAGEKAMKVKQAEAYAEGLYLQGTGIARERQALLAGLASSVGDFAEAVPGVATEQISNLMVATQYYDMVKEIGAGPGKTRILMQDDLLEMNEITAACIEQLTPTPM
jgi:hypothetical protein